MLRRQVEFLVQAKVPQLLFRHLVGGAYYVRAEAIIALRNIAVSHGGAFMMQVSGC